MLTTTTELSTLAHPSPPSGADGATGAEMDSQQKNSLVPVPVIDLPHRWDETGQLVPGTSPIECPLCKWNGDPEKLFDGSRYVWLTGRDCTREPLKCASCEILRCILFKTAEIEGRPVTDTSTVCGSIPLVPVTFDGLDNIWQSIFLSSDFPKSDIDRYGVIRRFRSSHDRLCDASTRWAQDCLAKCASSHELCHLQSGNHFLPTRLINLQPGWEGLDVRLEDDHSVRSGSLYIALSYSWGAHRPDCITTVETLARNKVRIPWDKLSLTFQHAAAFTLSLGIQFLWIDSICIIQEDEEDWKREAGKMFAVYKNSYLTLAALAGRDSTSGLRNMSVEQGSVLLAELRIDQTNYPLHMRQNHYLDTVAGDNIKGSFDDVCCRYPLLSRAWAYQERTVSPRVIFFTESEMIFQCLSNAECECGATQEYCQGNAAQLTKTEISRKTSIRSPTRDSSGQDRSAGTMNVQMRAFSDIKTKFKHFVSQRSRDDTHAKSRARQAAMTWRQNVVWEYSALAISMPRDRLPAVGAIAEQFQRVRAGDTYLAGLWSGSLLDDLLWISGGPALRYPKSKDRLERPFSLPTWSWASLHSSIVYPHDGVSVPKAKVLEAKCSYAGDNPFGVLQSSKLILSGRVLSSLLKWDVADASICFHDGNAWTEFSDTTKGMRRALWVDMDRDQDGFQNIPAHQEIDILEISTSTGGSFSRSEWHFLLLRRADPDSFVYTRAGKATFILDQEKDDEQAEGELTQHGFEDIFEGRSVLTTCEIR